MTAATFPIVVLISGNGSNLQAIIDAIHAKKLAATICAVISNRADAYGLERARKAKIPVHVITNQEFKNREAYDEALQQCIDQYKPKLIVLAGFMRILGKNFVRHYAGKIINIHPSLLPKHTGLNTHARVLAAGDKDHGVTIHFVTENLDEGPVIAQKELQVAASDTAETLKQKVHELEHRLYPQVIQQFAEGELTLEKGKVKYLKDRK